MSRSMSRAAQPVLSLNECKAKVDTWSSKTFLHTKEDLIIVLNSLIIYFQSGENLEVDKFAFILEKLKNVVQTLFEQLDTAEKKIKDLQEKVEQFQVGEVNLLIGELASSVEKKIVAYVLNGTGISTDYITIRNIDDALEKREHCSHSKDIFISSEQEHRAKQNKAKLSADFPSIDGKLYRAIHHYKHCRNIQAHPKPNETIARLGQLIESQHIKNKETVEMVDKLMQISKAL
uniref:Uncharacterized protein n=1 Tax=Amphimedon queenslandica TaxID=400682 RepID=A0A1X7T6L2_AMPQE